MAGSEHSWWPGRDKAIQAEYQREIEGPKAESVRLRKENERLRRECDEAKDALYIKEQELKDNPEDE